MNKFNEILKRLIYIVFYIDVGLLILCIGSCLAYALIKLTAMILGITI